MNNSQLFVQLSSAFYNLLRLRLEYLPVALQNLPKVFIVFFKISKPNETSSLFASQQARGAQDIKYFV